MTVLQTLAIILSGVALADYINHRYLRLPSSIGMVSFALLTSGLCLIVQQLGWYDFSVASEFMRRIDFTALLLHGMLAYLLFAGAMHIDLADLRAVKVVVFTMATVGVMISAAVTGGIIWGAGQLFHFEIGLLPAFIFGALIAPTDPIAVLATLKSLGVSRRFYAKIGGESLFNDGVAVVLFITLLGIYSSEGAAQVPSLSHIVLELVKEIVGGGALGFVSGWLAFQLIQSVDDYKLDVLITLALATVAYSLADAIGVSAPISVAVAGLIIGHHGRRSEITGLARRHLSLFWEMVDDILNGALFLLIGLELFVVSMNLSLAALGAAAIFAVFLGRYISVSVPITIYRLIKPKYIDYGTIRLLTWGGMRGGISIALALSLPNGADKDLILAMTYVVVVFSILVQGLTFRKLTERILAKNSLAKAHPH